MTGNDDPSRFVASQRRSFLAVPRDGAPMLFPITCFSAHGSVYFQTYRKSRKVTDLQTDPTAGTLVLTHEQDPHPRAAWCRGSVEFLDEPDFSVMQGVDDHLAEPGASERNRSELLSGARVMFRLRPEISSMVTPVQPRAAGTPITWPDDMHWGGRPFVTMTPEETGAFLAAAPYVAVCGEGPDGMWGAMATIEPTDALVRVSFPAGTPVPATGSGLTLAWDEFPHNSKIRSAIVRCVALAPDGCGLLVRPTRAVTFDFSKAPPRRTPSTA